MDNLWEAVKALFKRKKQHYDHVWEGTYQLQEQQAERYTKTPATDADKAERTVSSYSHQFEGEIDFNCEPGCAGGSADE